jgi:hypothetical protein
VFDAYRGGEVLDRELLERAVAPGNELPIHHRAIEEAVLELLAG